MVGAWCTEPDDTAGTLISVLNTVAKTSKLPMQFEQLAARDPGSTRIVYVIVIALVVGGVALAFFARWLLRTTQPDPELLAPLEAIDGRQWQRLDPAGRRRLLDGLRPDGAEPLDRAPTEPNVEDDFSDDVDLRDVRDLSGALAGADWSEWDDQSSLGPAGDVDQSALAEPDAAER